MEPHRLEFKLITGRNIEKKLERLEEWIDSGEYAKEMKNAKQRTQYHWKKNVSKYFNVRKELFHKPCDGLLSKSLKIKTTKEYAEIYVDDISRSSTSGSGGQVYDLFGLLMSGAGTSSGKYLPRFDRKHKWKGTHPGFSNQPAHSLWQVTIASTRKNIIEDMRDAFEKVRKSK